VHSTGSPPPWAAGARFADAASEQYGVDRSRIHYYGENPALDPTAIEAESTAENIRAGFAALVESMEPDDDLVLLMAGHGTFRDEVARFNIPGPDLTPEDLAGLLDGLGDRRITVVNTATASGPFVEALSADGRVVITATRSELQAQWAYVSTVTSHGYQVADGPTLRTLPGATGRRIVGDL